MSNPIRKYTNEIVEKYNAGMSIAAIASLHGVTRQAMWEALRVRGCAFRSNKKFGAENTFFRGTKSHPKAHDKVEKAILYGRMERGKSCEKCGASGTFKDGRSCVQAHHDDYNKPLAVRWLCQKCHHEWHKTNVAIPVESEKA